MEKMSEKNILGWLKTVSKSDQKSDQINLKSDQNEYY